MGFRAAYLPALPTMHALRQGVTCGVTAGVRPQASVAVPSGSVQQRKRPDADAAPALVISRRDAALAALLSTLVAPWVQPSDATAATSTSRVHWQSLAEVAEAGAAAQSSSTERIRQDYDTYAVSLTTGRGLLPEPETFRQACCRARQLKPAASSAGWEQQTKHMT